LYSDLAAIVIYDRGGATQADHDRITDIGVHPAFDRRKTMALIDRQIACVGTTVAAQDGLAISIVQPAHLQAG
jgi:3-hydroxy-3-methylglutaryl CoA synthase